MSNRMNGWIPDLPDHRDRPYSELRPQNRLFKAIVRPSACYLKEDNLPRIYNQGQIGSCVGHGVAEACAYVLDYLYSPKDGKKPGDLSRLFAYFIARRNKREDTGAYIRDGVKAIAQFGICNESLWPYDESQFATQPPREAFVAASRRKKDIEYFRIETLGDMMDCIAQGFPIVYGMTLFDSFNFVGADGEVPMPTSQDGVVGGHCMLIIGYSTTKKAFFVRNSWGENWGYRGHCWVPFEYIEKFGSDFWTVRRLSK